MGSVREYVKDFSSLMFELRRQGFKGLQSTIADPDSLIDYKAIGVSEAGQKKKDADRGKEKENKGKSWKSKKKFNKGNASRSMDLSQHAVGDKKPGCFICNGDYHMRDCPKKTKLNALVADDDEDHDATAPRVNPLQLLSAIQRDSHA